jgi:hypothetical protein
VAPIREKSIFWHEVCVDCGRPRDGTVANIMRRNSASITLLFASLKTTDLTLSKTVLRHQF